jgi:imidazole glycerol-phosphate synthase subunit HisH
MLVVVNYGLGNLRSLGHALDRLGVAYQCSSDPAVIRAADGLILPGVGAFQDGMANLRRLDLVQVLDEVVLEGQRPILGICLGVQLMAAEGREFGGAQGLGWIDAVVAPIVAAPEIRIPHVGWNECARIRESEIFSEIPDDALFYFTHSYHVACNDQLDITAFSDHGGRFVAAVEKGNIFGTQFHPEKSQQHGLSLLRNFARKVVGEC